MYELPATLFLNLITYPDNVREGNRLAAKNGLQLSENERWPHCRTCPHYEGNGINSFRPPGAYVPGCSYSGNSIQHTEQFVEQDDIITTWASPCLGIETRIRHLVNTGQLDEFFTDEKKDFLNIRDLVKGASDIVEKPTWKEMTAEFFRRLRIL